MRQLLYTIAALTLITAATQLPTEPTNLSFTPAGSVAGEAPTNWQRSDATKPGAADYEVGAGTEEAHAGDYGAYLRSLRKPPTNSYVMLGQSFLAAPYRGGHVRFSAWLRPQAVRKRSGLYLFVDGKGKRLHMDNTEDRLVKGSSGWVRLELVQAVPAEAEIIGIGAMLFGEGRLSVADAMFEKVGVHLATTHDVIGEALVRGKPENLNFFPAKP